MSAWRERLHAVLAAPLPATVVAGDQGAAELQATPRRAAAVLIGIVARADDPTILFTRRTAHLKAHAGQISFPGGSIEPKDTGPVAAALREAHEEIGLDPLQVEVLGRLDPYDTITGFRIHPIVGWIEPPVAFALDPFEVEELFEVPLAFVLDRANHASGTVERGGRTRRFFRLPFRHYDIWGATAGMLVNFVAAVEGAAGKEAL